MDCNEVFQRRNYSAVLLNWVLNDDSGSWWWWINVIGTLFFGLIGLIGNFICFLVIQRFTVNSYSFVEYLRPLCLFDFFALLYEFVQSSNDLSNYLFSVNFLKFQSAIVCKLYEYFKYSVILLSCWTIVALTVDRFLLVCQPFKKRWPTLSRRFCNAKSARCLLIVLICSSLIINIPHLIYKQWVCRQAGFEHSAVIVNSFSPSNRANSVEKSEICSCRISPDIDAKEKTFFLYWTNYVFHLCFYTMIPAIILIFCNTAILRRLNAPRTVISNQNEYLRSKLTTTLTAVSSIFLILYTPYAIVQTVSYFVVRSYMSKCDIIFVLRLKIFKRLSELLNIIALGINFFFYILAINHYRSSAIKMLRLDQIRIFTKVKQTPTTSQSNKLRTIDQTHEPELYQIHRTTNGHLKTTINGCSSSITPSSTYV